MTAGFEVIVRPVILPNIRPASPRVLTAEDDPSSGIAVLSGAGGRLIDLTQSQQSSWSRSRAVEKKRKFDVERIYKKDEDGEVDRGTYVDVERLKKITVLDGKVESTVNYAQPPERDNIEILQTDQERINDEAAQ